MGVVILQIQMVTVYPIAAIQMQMMMVYSMKMNCRLTGMAMGFQTSEIQLTTGLFQVSP